MYNILTNHVTKHYIVKPFLINNESSLIYSTISII